MHHAFIIVGTPKGINKTIVVLEKIVFSTCKNVIRKKQVQWNLDITKGHARECEKFLAMTRFRYTEVLFHIFYYYCGVKELYKRQCKTFDRGGGGGLNKVLYRECPPRSPTPHPFYTIFGSFDHFLIIPLYYNFHLTNGTPYTYLVKALPAFNCCKFTVCLLICKSHKTRTFSRLFISYKMHLLAFSYSSYSSTREIPTLSYNSININNQ